MIVRGVEAKYKVELRLNGTYIGDIRELAEGLVWKRSRTAFGVDTISFTLNDVAADAWLQKRGSSLYEVMAPFALDCRIVRNGVEVCGGYLATIPAYQPNQASANLQFSFDGYHNLLGGVYIAPQATQTGKMGELVSNWIQVAETRSTAAGKAFGFTEGTISDMESVEYTFENYKTVKDAIGDRCDNTSGAGPFDVYWHPDRTYDVIKDADFGDTITGYRIFYPARQNGVSAISISAPEMSDFASTVIGIGSGDISNNPDENTAITSTQTNSDFVTKYGYYETMITDSSVTEQTTLDNNVATELSNRSSLLWTPELTLSGVQVSPTPDGEQKIWIGDRIEVINQAAASGLASGWVRINELEVSVSAAGAETVKPTVETVSESGGSGTMGFYNRLRRIQNELLNLKTAH